MEPASLVARTLIEFSELVCGGPSSRRLPVLANVGLSNLGEDPGRPHPADTRPTEGETVGVQVNLNKLHLFDAKMEETLLR